MHQIIHVVANLFAPSKQINLLLRDECGCGGTGIRASPRSLFLEVRVLSSAPNLCRGGATGRRADLKHQLLRVQISPPVPNVYAAVAQLADAPVSDAGDEGSSPSSRTIVLWM